MKKFVLLSVTFFCAYAFSQEKVFLTEAMIPELIKKKNPIVHSDEMKIKAAEAQTGSLIRSYIPKVSLQFGQESFKYVSDEYNSGPYYKAGVDINLYSGGRDRLKENSNQVDLKIAKSNKVLSVFSQIEEARKAFWKALYFKHLIEKLNEGKDWVARNKVAAMKRINSGVATDSDRFEFEIKMVEIAQDVERAKLAFQRQLQYLKILFGMNENIVLRLEQPLSHDHNWKSLINHSEKSHDYLFASEKLQIQKDEINSKMAGSLWLPKLEGYAFFLQNNLRRDFDRLEESDRQQTVVGIRASWTFTDFIEGNIKKESAKAMVDSRRLRLKYNEKRVENKHHMELKELELLDRLIHDADKNIDRSRTFFKLISNEYKRGVKTSGDMLVATEKLMNSHIRKLAILRDFQLAKAHVMKKLKR